jgi:SulP family sulfate permease
MLLADMDSTMIQQECIDELADMAGVALSLLLFLWRTSTPHMAIVGQVPGTEHFRNVDRHAVITDPAILSLRVDESLYFANARYLEDRIYAEVAARPALRQVILMCPAVNLIDASALESLEAIADRLRAAGVGFHLSEVKGPVMDALKRSDFFDHFKGQVFLSQFDAMRALVMETSAPAAATASLPAAGNGDAALSGEGPTVQEQAKAN